MNRLLFAVVLAGIAVTMLSACNTSGLSNKPRATFSQLACLDINGDNRVNDADAQDMSKLPDFNADRTRDADDAAFLQSIDIELAPDRDRAQCTGKAKDTPEYLVAHGYVSPSDVSCDGGAQPVLIAAVGGGSVNLKNDNDAAGVREVADELISAFDDKRIDTIAVVAGPAIGGAANPNSAMEQWLTHAARVYLDRYPCLRVVTLGHSLGATVSDVVAARLEGEYGDRMIADIAIDRIDLAAFYAGDRTSRPQQASVFNIFELNDGLHGVAYDSPNAENWDASGENGTDGKPVDHTSIDNAPSVHKRIVAEVMERLG